MFYIVYDTALSGSVLGPNYKQIVSWGQCKIADLSLQTEEPTEIAIEDTSGIDFFSESVLDNSVTFWYRPSDGDIQFVSGGIEPSIYDPYASSNYVVQSTSLDSVSDKILKLTGSSGSFGIGGSSLPLLNDFTGSIKTGFYRVVQGTTVGLPIGLPIDTYSAIVMNNSDNLIIFISRMIASESLREYWVGFRTSGNSVSGTVTWADINGDNFSLSGNNTITGSNVFSGSQRIIDNSLIIAGSGGTSKEVKFDVSNVSPSTVRTITIPDVNSEMLTTGGAQTITGSKTYTGEQTFQDNKFLLQDDLDPTKQARFQLTNISPGTIRFIQIPDIGSTEMIVSAGSQTIVGNKTFTGENYFTDSKFHIIDNLDQTKEVQFQVSGISSGTTRTITIPDISSEMLTTGGAQTITGNKTFTGDQNFQDNTFFLFDELDTTKKARFQVSNVTPGTSRSLVIPDISGGEIIVSTGTQTISGNKTFTGDVFITDSNLFLRDNLDDTKQVKFQVSGVTTGTTRTITVPDSDGTLAYDTVFTSSDKGLVPASGGGTSNFLRADGTWAAPGGGGSPGGSNTQLQFNDGGVFGGDSDLTWNKTTNTLKLSGNDTGIELTGITNEPSAPTSGSLRLYSKSIAGRMIPKFKGPSGIDTPLQDAFWQNSICMWNPTTATAGVWLGTAGSGAGTYSTALPTTTNLYTTMKRGRWANVVTTANQVLGQRNTEAMFFRGSGVGGGFFFFTRCGMDVWTNGGRFFAGFHTGTTVISADPSSLNNTVGFCVDAADNGAISFLTRGTAATKASTGFTFSSNTGFDLYIFCAPGSSSIGWRIVSINNATEASGTATLTLPNATTMMTAGVLASNAALTTVTSIQLGINRIFVETDY